MPRDGDFWYTKYLMKSSRAKTRHIVGIDEVGRGPIAGEVAVGAVLLYAEYLSELQILFPEVKDSKKLSPKVREEWFLRIKEARTKGYLEIAVTTVPPSVIDKKGIVYAIRTALDASLEKVRSVSGHAPNNLHVLLDGGLKAPQIYPHQETIIKGDEKELAIALASVAAKVYRDKRMTALGKKFPAYGFEDHKGYGTRAHYQAIKDYGLCPHHRKSFLKNLA